MPNRGTNNRLRTKPCRQRWCKLWASNRNTPARTGSSTRFRASGGSVEHHHLRTKTRTVRNRSTEPSRESTRCVAVGQLAMREIQNENEHTKNTITHYRTKAFRLSIAIISVRAACVSLGWGKKVPAASMHSSRSIPVCMRSRHRATRAPEILNLGRRGRSLHACSSYRIPNSTHIESRGNR